jgi:uncharacterized protein (TIGR03435 family)
MNSTFFPVRSPHVSATNVTTKFLLRMGYGVKDFQLSGGPAWIDSERYDISADIDEAQFEQLKSLPLNDQIHQVQLLIQSVLADRFKLRITHGTKELPTMALVAGKSVSKLDQFAGDQATNNPTDVTSTGFGNNGLRIIKAPKTTMDRFASVLSAMLGQQLVNKTAISGNYAFTFSWTDVVQAAPNTPSDSGPSLQAALEDQLGLELESTKAPVDAINIDHIEEPTPN